MSATVTYKGSVIAEVTNDTKKLNTQGNWLEDDITITDVSGSGSNWQSGIYASNGYIYLSPHPGAGGVTASEYVVLNLK